MNSSQFIEKLQIMAARKNYYSNKYPYNCCYVHPDGRTSADCWNLIKCILNGYDVSNNTPGYYQKGFPLTGDTDANGLLKQCSNVSADFKNLIPGEFLYMPIHAGTYIGTKIIDGKEYNVIECTGSWERKILYSYVDIYGRRFHYKGAKQNGSWKKHGRLKLIKYETSEPVIEKEDYNMRIISKGSKGKAVKIWQVIVGVTADGDFGNNTYKATKQFQKLNGLQTDGIVGPKTWSAGLNSNL